jgi:TPR repeat protein
MTNFKYHYVLAIQGDRESQYRLGRYYRHGYYYGDGVEIDLEQSFYWYLINFIIIKMFT